MPEALPENAILAELTAAATAAATASDYDAYDAAMKQIARLVDQPPDSRPYRPTPLGGQSTPVPVASKGVATRTPGQMPSAWGTGYRGFPNTLLRGALFTIRRKEERVKFENEPITTTKDVILLYSGQELRMRDEDVAMQVFHFQRNRPVDTTWSVTAGDFLSALGWGTGSRSYYDLYDSLIRLADAKIKLLRKNAEGSEIAVGGLFHLNLQRKRGDGGPHTKIQIAIPLGTVALWDFMGYTLIDWEQRLALSGNLARWLHSYYSTHSQPYPMAVDTFRRFSGSSCRDLARFRQLLRDALDALIEINFLSRYWIDSGDLVHVDRIKRVSAK